MKRMRFELDCRVLFVLSAVLALQTGGAAAAEPPAIAPPVIKKCDTCDTCKCPAGFCPKQCVVAAKPAKVQYQLCVNGRCAIYTVDAGSPIPLGAKIVGKGADVEAAAAVSYCPTGNCSSGTCSAPSTGGWYPGKLLGRRR